MAADWIRHAIHYLRTLPKMKLFALLILGFQMMACSFLGSNSHQGWDKDEKVMAGTIEEYILETRPFQFHEEATSDFSKRVRSARSLTENRGNDSDYLYLDGDGSYPAKEFKLDRKNKTMTVLVFPGEASDHTSQIKLKRSKGSWITIGADPTDH